MHFTDRLTTYSPLKYLHDILMYLYDLKFDFIVIYVPNSNFIEFKYLLVNSVAYQKNVSLVAKQNIYQIYCNSNGELNHRFFIFIGTFLNTY